MDTEIVPQGACPLYLTVEEAARYAGIGVNAMRAFVDSHDPPPILEIGSSRNKRKYVERDGLARYLRAKQTWSYQQK
ncbi:excisionase [Olsenella phocaeensis]|uniref:excisionase n=1 Tax=Olsenella phocaeensis TaxID=1852385 RepID=UPI0009301C97|nr:excisionase [Olsenella phocaeensis]